MSDIVERLRRVAKELPQTSGNQAWLKPEDTTAWEAADEIERLRAAVQTARRDALEEAVSRVTAYSQNETARNIVTIIYALGEKE